MKWILRLFKVLGVVLLLLCISLAGVVWLLGSQQQQLVQQGLAHYNETIAGNVQVDKSRISVFQNFPYISIDLKGVSVYESKADSNAIVQLDDVYVGFDLWKLIAGKFEVKKVKLKGGNLFVRAYADGSYNLLNALKSSEAVEDTTPTPIELNVKSFVVQQVHIIKTSDADKTLIDVLLQNLSSSFKKTDEKVLAQLKGNSTLSVAVKDSFYVKEKPVFISTKVHYNKQKQLLTISPSELKLQGVAFTLLGKADIQDDMNLDLNIKGEKEDFSLLIALMPDELLEFMKRYKNAGNIYFDARIKGKNLNGHIPVVTANFGCKNGYFKNTNVNRTLDDLSFAGYFTTGSERNLSQSEFRLLDLNARPEQGVIKANLILKNFKDPYVDLKVFTDFDLQFLADFLQVSTLQNLKGKVMLDVNYNELVDINNPQTALQGVKQGINSKLTVRNLEFKIPGYPLTLKNINASASMDKGKLTLDSLSLNAGNSDITFKGYLSDLPALLHNESKKVEIDFSVNSNLLDFYSLTTVDSEKIKPFNETVTGLRTRFTFTGDAQQLKSFTYLPQGEFHLEDFYARLKNYPHTLHDFDARIKITGDEIIVKNLDGEIDRTDIHFLAHIFNYPKWFKGRKEGFSKIDFSIASNHIYPANLLSYKGVNYLPQEYRSEDIKQLNVKGNLALHYQENKMKAFDLTLSEAKALLTLHPLKIEEISGKIHGEEGVISSDNLKLRMGNSDVALTMKYHYGKDVKKKENSFNLKSTLLDIDQLSNYNKRPQPDENDMKVHEDSFNIFQLPFANNTVNMDIGSIRYHKVRIDNMKGRIRMRENHFLYIDTLSMDVAGGHIDLSGYFNGSNPDKIYFSPNFSIYNVDLQQLLIKADNFGQQYVLNDNIKGQVTGKIRGTLRMYPDLFPIIQESDIEADVMLKNGTIVNFAPLQVASDFFRDRNLRYVRFDTLQNTFRLKNNELTFPAMTINSSLGFIEVAGRQNLNSNLDYTVRIPWALVTNVAVNKLFGGRNKNEIPDDQVDDIIRRDETRKTRFINIQVSGSTENYKVSLAKRK